MLTLTVWMQELWDELHLAQSLLTPLHQLGKEDWVDELEAEMELMREALYQVAFKRAVIVSWLECAHPSRCPSQLSRS